MTLELSCSRSEQRLRSLFDRNPDAVYAFDLAGRFTEANAACERVSGYAPAELIGRSFEPLVVPEHRARMVTIFRRAAEGRPQRFACAILHRDGRRVALRGAKLPIVVDGEVVGVYGVSHDVTDDAADERRARSPLALAEEALRGSRMRQQLIVEAAYDPFVGFDDGGRITDWNAHAERAFGWSRDEAVGRDAADTLLAERDRRRYRRGVARYLATGRSRVMNQRLRVAARHRSGREFAAEMTLTAARVAGARAFCAFLHDVSEAEDSVRARERAALLEEFATGIRHELNNVLATVYVEAQLLAEEEVPEGMRPGVAAILEGSRRMSEVLRRLADVGGLRSVPYLGGRRMLDFSPRRDGDGG